MAGSTTQPLSKKDLQEALKPLATKDELKSLATKEDLKPLATKAALGQQTKELKAYADEQTQELARIVNGAFEKVGANIHSLSTRAWQISRLPN